MLGTFTLSPAYADAYRLAKAEVDKAEVCPSAAPAPEFA